MTVEFIVTLRGRGETVEECWDNAVDSFAIDPGTPPDHEIVEEDEEELSDEDD